MERWEVAHRRVHSRQRKEDGWFKYWLKYIFSRKARLNYEAEAFAVETDVRIALIYEGKETMRGIQLYQVESAKKMNRWFYFWFMRYGKILNAVKSRHMYVRVKRKKDGFKGLFIKPKEETHAKPNQKS